MKTLNWIRRIIGYPIRLIGGIILLPVVFLSTDWEDSWDVSYFKRTMTKLFKL